MDNLNEKEKRDRCLRIADRKFDKPSAYKSGAVVRCRKGDIWKDLKENTTPSAKEKIDELPQGKIFDDAKNIEGIFKKSSYSWSEVVELFEKNKNKSKPEVIDTKDVYITQLNIQANKVKNMLDKVNKLPPVNVVEFEDGEKVIYDGHHRLIANWALNNSKIEVNLVKLDNLKEADDPQAGKAAPYGSGYAKVRQAIQELIQEDETLHKWFNRRGGNGEKGWVDCNTCREVDGKTKCKPCGRKKGEERAKYPSCRPTPAGCKDKGKGKTWGKTKENMIKLKDLILELDSEKIFHIEGIIIIDDQKRNIQDILSDIRALAGITIVRNIDIEQDQTSRYYKSKLEIKIDPYPYIKQNKFDSNSTLELISNNIKAVPGVIGFKQTANPYSTDN
jgi:hypothetical protein